MKRFKGWLAILLLGLSAFFGYAAFWESYPFLKTEFQNKVLRQQFVIEGSETIPTVLQRKEKREIDFHNLKKRNPDIVGWIYIPDTTVDYPILHGEKYLHLDPEGKENKLGSIFTLNDASTQLKDFRTLLFGHNMKQRQMFGELKAFLQEDFRKSHEKIFIYTPEKTMKLKIFSIFICKETDSILYQKGEMNDEEKVNCINECMQKNVYKDLKAPLEVPNKNIFSLVTCNGRQGTSERLVINAAVCDTEDSF